MSPNDAIGVGQHIIKAYLGWCKRGRWSKALSCRTAMLADRDKAIASFEILHKLCMTGVLSLGPENIQANDRRVSGGVKGLSTRLQ